MSSGTSERAKATASPVRPAKHRAWARYERHRFCQGCGIGERIDTAQMGKVATREGKMAIVREHAFLCNAEGVQMIKDDIEKEGVNHIMIAACSRRAKTEAFYFPHVAMARANIREGVIWTQPDTPEAKEFTSG